MPDSQKAPQEERHDWCPDQQPEHGEQVGDLFLVLRAIEDKRPFEH
ncbi:hypothetical protein SAMN05444747_10432 [Variovorax sp. OV329]|nr:hypothetical protein SAMN05444747_10432 [Variovorax sp. OV329]